MKSLLFKTVEMCEEWEEKKQSDIQLITGLRDVINEMSDLLIKAETEKAELIEAIELWWGRFKPVSFNKKEHFEHPYINSNNDANKQQT